MDYILIRYGGIHVLLLILHGIVQTLTPRLYFIVNNIPFLPPPP